MGEPILLLRLEGPLQSWGMRARWDVRDSAREPTKSGIVGLLAAALGYGRDEPRIAEELDSGLRMGTRVEREAGLLDDYHTVTGFFPMAEGGFKAGGNQRARNLEKLLADRDAESYTIQSRRRYLVDGAFLVALTAVPPATSQLLHRSAAALARPHWPLFLGRRSCVPTRPVFDTITQAYENIEAALERHPWSCLGAKAERRRLRTKPSRLRVILESEAGAPRDDCRRPGEARLFGRRYVREYMVNVPPENPENSS